MCLPLSKYLCSLFFFAGHLDRTGVRFLFCFFARGTVHTHTASTEYQIQHTEHCSIHFFGKPSNKWPSAPVTNLRDQTDKETREILKMEPTTAWAENQRVGFMAKTSSDPEADSDVKTQWAVGRVVGGKGAPHQKPCNHRVEMAESSFSAALFQGLKKAGGGGGVRGGLPKRGSAPGKKRTLLCVVCALAWRAVLEQGSPHSLF